MENNITSEIETWSNEELEKIKFRIRSFRVLAYKSDLQPDEDVPFDDDMKFHTIPQFYVKLPNEKAFVDYTAYVYNQKNKERIISSVSTLMEFDLFGILLKKVDEDYAEIKIPHPVLIHLISIALSSTRGAWSVLSGGKFIMPVIDLTKTEFTKGSQTNEIAPTAPPSSTAP